jgi:Tfp pilus assembly protein PilE
MKPSDQLLLGLSIAGVVAIIIVLYVVTKPSADQAKKKSKGRTANAEAVALPRQVRRALERKRYGKAGGDDAALAESLQRAREEALEVCNTLHARSILISMITQAVHILR